MYCKCLDRRILRKLAISIGCNYDDDGDCIEAGFLVGRRAVVWTNQPPFRCVAFILLQMLNKFNQLLWLL